MVQSPMKYQKVLHSGDSLQLLANIVAMVWVEFQRKKSCGILMACSISASNGSMMPPMF